MPMIHMNNFPVPILPVTFLNPQQHDDTHTAPFGCLKPWPSLVFPINCPVKVMMWPASEQ